MAPTCAARSPAYDVTSSDSAGDALLLPVA